MPFDNRKSVLLFEVSLNSPSCPAENIRVKIKIRVEHWWNNNDGGKLKS